MTDRRIGQTGTSVDFVPQAVERQQGMHGLTVDYAYPLGVQSGQLGVTVDLTMVTPPSRTGSLMLMVDYIAGVAVAGIGWDGTQFVASGATPVLWGAGAFQTSGSHPSVVFEDGAFEVSP